MIDRVEIENYRCLRQVDVPLRPLTVVIGPNNTGKSAFLSALRLPQLAKSGDSAQPSDAWMGNLEHTPLVRFSILGDDFVVSMAQSHRWVNDSRDTYSVTPVSLFGEKGLHPAMHSAGMNEKSGVPSLDDAASRLPAYLDAVLRLHRKRFERIIERLTKLVDGFMDLAIATPQANTRRIDIEWENGLRLHGDNASSGLKLLIFFVALAMHPEPPKLVLIDEPETGVHPKLLAEIVGLLRGLTTGAYADQATQVVLTTHSPYLLDCIDVEKDQVLVARHNDEDGSKVIEPVDEERLQTFLDEFMLGEVWYNQGESGLVSKATS